ncbi:hypothetical protein BDA96_03G176700 [Sorghum bicolor]|uniref:Uncharacterized protein n=1 Tax=Sorghum bicolor TaxID=4558 RepID=A0A921REL8_SORBI|nr:hypothetical protein BDA96_03G176700 [Sorghum bicolor]
MWEKKLLEEVKVWMWKVVVSFHLKTWKGTQWQADQVLASRLTTHLKPLPPFTDTSATVLDRAGGGGDAWSRGWERRCMALRMAAVARGRARSGAGKGDQAWARSGLGAGGGAGMGMCEPRGPRRVCATIGCWNMVSCELDLCHPLLFSWSALAAASQPWLSRTRFGKGP